MQNILRKRTNLLKSISFAIVTVGIMALNAINSYAQSQNCQTATVTTTTTIPLAGVHAGDTVTVEATLNSDDPDEDSEDEPLILMSPGLGTKTVSVYGVATPFTFTAAQDGETITAFIQGFDGDESATVKACFFSACSPAQTSDKAQMTQAAAPSCPKIEITEADITSNRIVVTLTPATDSGQLTLTLAGDSNVTLSNNVQSGGTHQFSFNPGTLPIGQYTQVQAVWTVNGFPASAMKAVSFKVLGVYHHSQYNTPEESSCTPATAKAYITDGNCAFQGANLRSQFISQANLNGSGVSINFGLVLREAFCIRSGSKHPSDSPDRSFRPGSKKAACPGDSLSNSTVARHPNNPDLTCGDQVLIVGLGTGVGTTKTVTDLCPGCAIKQLDNYTKKAACSDIPDLGNYVTIRINR